MKIESKPNCPLDNFNPCRQLECAWFMKIQGTNPQTGSEIDEWGCAVTWMPIMAIEIAQKSNQTGAAVESFRNEVVRANDENKHLYVNVLQQGVIQSRIETLPQQQNFLEGDLN